MLFKHTTSETNIFSFSISKESLNDIIDCYVKDLDKEEVKELRREVDNLVYSIEDTKLSSNYVCPYELNRFFSNMERIKVLALRLDSILRVSNDYEEDYDFHLHLLRYITQAIGKAKNDSANGKIHLCFSYEPKQPSDYNGISDTKVSYDSILCKFYYSAYLKHIKPKGSSKGGCAYFVAFTYLLVISQMYYILQPLITDVSEFLWHCFSCLNPVVVGFTMTSRYRSKGINAVSFIYELFQLTSKSKNLIIEKNQANNTVKFVYTTLGKPFKHSTHKGYKPLYMTDNDGKRKVQMLVSGRGNIVTIRYDFIGLSVLFDIIGKAVDKDLFSLPANDIMQMIISERTLLYMLSYTDFRDKRLESEKLLYQAKMLVDKFNLTKYQMDYVVIATTLAKLDKESISKRLSSLGTAQQSKIRKMIKAVQSCNIPELDCLYSIDNKYCWWGK